MKYEISINQSKYNEQLKMLCIAVDDKKTAGFMMYKCNDESNQLYIAKEISKSITKSNLVINASELTEEMLPSNLYNINKLLKESNAKVVTICNIQKCEENLNTQKTERTWNDNNHNHLGSILNLDIDAKPHKQASHYAHHIF